MRPQTAPHGLLPLLREIGDLKRVTSAGRAGSIATRLFGRSWAALAAGQPVADVAFATSAAALAATRLGDLDPPALVALGLADGEARAIQRRALDDLGDVIPADLATPLRDAAGTLPQAESDLAFVAALAAQPRAGVTCPGKPRIVLLPAENHAEHCLVVAVYAVLLAPTYGADPATAFLAGLAHHLHNAGMPDAGFTGETLLGDHLAPVMAAATARALAELAPDLRDAVVTARRILPDAESPEGRAFHAADVIDRVIEIDQHLVAASLTMRVVLDDMALVHDGPVKAFHDGVLAEMGLS